MATENTAFTFFQKSWKDIHPPFVMVRAENEKYEEVALQRKEGTGKAKGGGMFLLE